MTRPENGPSSDKKFHLSDQIHHQDSVSSPNGTSIQDYPMPRPDAHSTPSNNGGFDDRYNQFHEPSPYQRENLGPPQYLSHGIADPYGDYDDSGQKYQRHEQSMADYPQTLPSHTKHETSSVGPIQDAYNMPKISSSSFLPQHSSMLEVGKHQEQAEYARLDHRNSLPQSENFDANNIRHHPVDESHVSYSPHPYHLNDETPPPPPVHRSSGLQTPPKPSGKSHADSYPPITGPAPLNIRHARNSISASPLSQVHNSLPPTDDEYSVSPTTTRREPHSYQNHSPHHPYSSPERRQSPEHVLTSPSRDYNQPTPPSLVPGYDPRLLENQPEKFAHESQRPSARQYSEPSPQYQAYATQREPTSAQPSPRNDVPVQLRMLGNNPERRPHRASAPVIPRREVTPEVRTPMRKSVSPQPETRPGERRQSAVPFGPDSYDAFNPSLNDAASVNSTGPKYNTPEQAKEAQYERAQEAKLAEGPIIGSDGREIDPSDHLPAETWAPEPESKVPKKKPEITVRFRRGPAGAQPMPANAGRPMGPVSRPAPMVTPVYAHSSDAISPTAAARNRLQKKTRVAVAQPMSSPAVPTVNTDIAGMPRAASDRSLQEHENYGYTVNQPYARSSPGSVPPPIPGKVPLSAGAGQEDWGMSALSQEMQRIDIGVGAGQRRAQRDRYGVSGTGRY